jgi:hypothetical protein
VTSLSVVTPSYAPDFPLFRELHASVLTWTTDDVVHHVVVPRRDVRLFSELAGPRCRVLALEDNVPRRMVGIPGRNVYVNVRRPFPPIRGWVMQQLLKLDLARTIGTRLVLLIDSDIVLVRPFGTDDLIRNGAARFYRGQTPFTRGSTGTYSGIRPRVNCSASVPVGHRFLTTSARSCSGTQLSWRR